MKFLSVCSGIEAASVAWEPLGWEAVAFSEIEKFPSAVLAHHWPDVPNLGDMTQYNEWKLNQPIDLLVGGTPCQSFSVAGLRKGLQDPRGNLTLTFLAMAEKFKPRWVVWENVPGVLSDKTNAFGQFLAGLGELGYGFAYRVLDAQHFRVPQRRRRVFVVGCLGDWASAAKVLFEPESLCGDLTPSREKREGSAISTPEGIGVGSLCARTGRSMSAQDAAQGHIIPQWPKEIAPTLNTAFGSKMGLEDQHALGGAGHFVPDVMGTITARMFNALGSRDVEEGAVIPFSPHNQTAEKHEVSQTLTARGDIDNASCIAKPIAFGWQNSSSQGASTSGFVTPTLDKSKTPALAFDAFNHATSDVSHTLRTGSDVDKIPQTVTNMQVRRLTPTECERLQGFPDDHTLIPWRNKPAEECPDGPRYKALGNSMAIPVVYWIGKRIQDCDEMY
jgi:DNA (cytosine-5)-methyltransferase 1